MVDIVAKYGRTMPPTAGIIEDMACQDLSNAWSGVVSIEDALKSLQTNCEDEMASW